MLLSHVSAKCSLADSLRHSIAGAFYIELFYLPIYFQAVKGASPVASGVHLIPLIGGMSMLP